MSLATIGLLSWGIAALWLVAALVVLAVLVRLYSQTRMTAFIWLIVALVLWPLLARAVSMTMPYFLTSYLAQRYEGAATYAFLTVAISGVETIVGVVLLLVAVLVLQREFTQRLTISGTSNPLAPAPVYPNEAAYPPVFPSNDGAPR